MFVAVFQLLWLKNTSSYILYLISDDPNEVELPLDDPLIPLRPDPDAQDAYYIIALLNPYPEAQDDAMFFGIYYTRL